MSKFAQLQQSQAVVPSGTLVVQDLDELWQRRATNPVHHQERGEERRHDEGAHKDLDESERVTIDRRQVNHHRLPRYAPLTLLTYSVSSPSGSAALITGCPITITSAPFSAALTPS